MTFTGSWVQLFLICCAAVLVSRGVFSLIYWATAREKDYR